MPFPNFLDKEQREKLPEGGQFSPTGLIGQWGAMLAYTFYANDADDAIAADEGVAPDDIQFGWWIYRDYNAAVEAIEKLDIRGQFGPPRPDTVWRFEAEKKTILNLAKADSWSDPVAAQVNIKTLKSVRYRHALHLVSLPMAVAAMANAYGYDSPGFDIHELCDPDVAFTDEFYARLCGDPDSKGLKGLDDAVLWQRRAELWKALGEEDATRYKIPEGEKVGKFDTEAPKLQDCLGVIAYKWTSPVWSRLLLVPDPRVDALSKSGNRLTIPCLVDIFEDKAQAEAAVAADKAAMEQDEEGTPTEVAGPIIPELWKDYPDDFKAEVKKFKATVEGKPKPLQVKAISEYEAFEGCDPAEVAAWL